MHLLTCYVNKLQNARCNDKENGHTSFCRLAQAAWFREHPGLSALSQIADPGLTLQCG